MKEHPVFSRFYRRLLPALERAEAPYRRETAGGAAGPVLEIGAGTGANLAHYPASARVVALEPEPNMVRMLWEVAGEAVADVGIVRGSAEALPFPDGAFRTVVASLVLCSVGDPALAAAEIRRVLAPGGELRFFEHVRGTGKLARSQDRVERVWGFFSGGCHPNRDTVSTLHEAGFAVRWRAFTMPHAWVAGPHVVGVAVRP
ncbi:MAG: class I SAM-dependent methyltransferase [Actinobacteria bacterium]|nr:class I SAM-dependent methyltransferase [Actinomycetota bacterium]